MQVKNRIKICCPILSMGESNQLTSLSTFCQELGPINWITLPLSLASPFKYNFHLLEKSHLNVIIYQLSYQNSKKKYSPCNRIYNVNKSFMWLWKVLKFKIISSPLKTYDNKSNADTAGYPAIAG